MDRSNSLIEIVMFKDCLVKQGMYTQYAENLLKTISSTVNSLKYDMGLAKNCIKSLKPELSETSEKRLVSKSSMPKLSSLVILVAIVRKLQVLMDEPGSKSWSNNADAKCVLHRRRSL